MKQITTKIFRVSYNLNDDIVVTEMLIDELIEWINVNEQDITILGIEERTFTDNAEISEKYEETIEELEDENQMLKERMENIQSHLDDALSYLKDVEYEIDNAYDETND